MVVAIILIATIIDGMDTSIVNIILPQIAKDLGMSISESSFIVISYMIPIAGLCLFFGKLADRVNLRVFFVTGTVIFMLASIACALSADSNMILISRFVQGFGAAFMLASTPIMVVRLLPEDARGRGMGIIAAGTGAASILGAPLGGILEELLSWHWTFLINIPFCIVLILLSMKVLPGGKPVSESVGMVDPKAVITMFLGMGLMMLSLYTYIDGLVELWLMAIGLAVSVILLMSTAYLSSHSEHPLVDRRMIMSLRFNKVSLVFLLSTMVGAGAIYLLPFYFHTVQEWDTLTTSIVMAISSILAVVTATPTGKWCDSRGCRTPASLALALRVLFSLGFMLLSPALGLIYVLILMVTMGISFGISGTSQSTRMIVESPEGLEGDAGVVAMLVNYVGYALGVALFAMVFSFMVPDIEMVGPSQFLDGFHWSMAFAMVISIVALSLSLAVKEKGC